MEPKGASGVKPARTITMGQLRAEPGEVLRSVSRDGESFVVTKSGRPVAKLVPMDGDDVPRAVPDYETTSTACTNHEDWHPVRPEGCGWALVSALCTGDGLIVWYWQRKALRL